MRPPEALQIGDVYVAEDICEAPGMPASQRLSTKHCSLWVLYLQREKLLAGGADVRVGTSVGNAPGKGGGAPRGGPSIGPIGVPNISGVNGMSA